MAMKKFLTFFTIAFVLTLTFSMWGFGCGQDVAVADDAVSYVYIAPADLKNNEFAGQTQVAVKDNGNGETLFYLVESYYYPVVKQITLGTTYYTLDIQGVDAVVMADDTMIIDTLPSGANADNILPQSILLKEGITLSIKGQTVDTRDGWTVKLIGVNDVNFFVQCSKDDITVCGSALKDNFTSANVQYHPIALAEREGLLNQTPDKGTIGGNNSTDKSVILRIVLIIGIAVPAIIIAIMIFKPGRASERTNYDRHAMRTRREEEMDYDRDRSYDRERDYSRRQPYDDRNYRDDRGYDNRYDDRRDRGYDDRRRDDRDDRGYDRYDDRRDRGYDDRYDDRNGRR
jgi:hypothetical protein